MPPTQERESRLRRALYALPILALSVLMMRAVAMAEPIAPVHDTFIERRHFNSGGVSASIVTEFYGIPLLDQIFVQITAAFANLQFYSDPLLYWQSLIFLTEYAGMYAILLLESCRESPKSTLFRYPLVLTFIGQIIPIGILSPIFFFSAYVFTPMEKFERPTSRVIRPAYAVAVFPTIALAYYIPHFPCYFHPSLEARNWWNWVWQLYPIWGSATLFVLSKFYAPKHDLPTVRATLGLLAAVNTAIFWYTLSASDVPLLETFVPAYIIHGPQVAELAIRTIIQYDYLCTFGAGYLWLAYSFGDLRATRACSYSWVRIIGTAILAGIVFGPGTPLLLGWIVREQLLASSQPGLGKARKKN